MMCCTADPCLYFKWSENSMVIMASWTDGNLIIGSKKAVTETKKQLMERFECDDCGEIKEYVGYKEERHGNKLKFMQQVLLQSFLDKFQLPTRHYKTPTIANSVLIPGEKDQVLEAANTTKYQSGVGKLMHMMQYSRPELYNPVCNLASHIQCPTQVHYKAMLRVMKYYVDTPNGGLMLKPEGDWDGMGSRTRTMPSAQLQEKVV